MADDIDPSWAEAKVTKQAHSSATEKMVLSILVLLLVVMAVVGNAPGKGGWPFRGQPNFADLTEAVCEGARLTVKPTQWVVAPFFFR